MTHRTVKYFAVTAVLVSGLAACGGDGLDPSATQAPGTTAAAGTSTPSSTSLVPAPTSGPSKPDPSLPDVPVPTIPEGVDPASVGYVTSAVEMLAEAQGVEPGDIEVIGFEEVVWRDGSIGCPIEGMMYTQALVDGTRVALGLDGEVYLFHAEGTGEPFLCENPAEPFG
jgi:hypothetical protein